MVAVRRCHATLLATIAAVLVAATGIANAQTVLALPEEPATVAREPADKAVSSHMLAVRKLVADNHTLITHRRLPPAAARRLASELRRLAAELTAGPQAAALANVTTQLAEGTTKLDQAANGDGYLDALASLEEALTLYAQAFDDPEWKPLR